MLKDTQQRTPIELTKARIRKIQTRPRGSGQDDVEPIEETDTEEEKERKTKMKEDAIQQRQEEEMDLTAPFRHIVDSLLEAGSQDLQLPPVHKEFERDEDGLPLAYVPPPEYFGEGGPKKKKQGLSDQESRDFSQLTKIVKAGKYLDLLNLLEKGAPTDTTDEFGNTPLIAAAQNGNRRFIKVLMRYGADFSAQNGLGNTALHYCKEYKFEECWDYLVSKGADPEQKNANAVPAREGISGESARKGGSRPAATTTKPSRRPSAVPE